MTQQKNYDSDFCGSLPLNNINVIQDYGYLLVVEPSSLKVLQFSENLAADLGIQPKDFLNQSLAELISGNDLEKLKSRIENPVRTKAPLNIQIKDIDIELLTHINERYIILEMEQKKSVDRTFNVAFEEVKFAIDHIEQCQTINDASKVAVEELQKITGFDGVMMYRFDKDWNGTVIAEVKGEGMEQYLGLTFPASDVPKQARQLYLKNPYRLIPNRAYQPIKLFPIVNPVTRSFTDMSACNVRGVAGVHLEYLKNMNVKASMSIRVIYHGELWGLIACHHKTEKYLSLEACSICELISSVVSAKVESLLHRDHADVETGLQRDQTQLLTQVFNEDDLVKGMFNNEQLKITDLFRADSAVAVINDRMHSIGDAPDREFIDNLILWLQTSEDQRLFVSDRLPLIFDEAKEVAELASGVLVFPVDAEQGNYIICFRKELKREINWGGDPNQAINFEPDKKNYHPRNSFNSWQEIIHHTAEAWTTQELAVAETVRSFIFEYQTKKVKF